MWTFLMNCKGSKINWGNWKINFFFFTHLCQVSHVFSVWCNYNYKNDNPLKFWWENLYWNVFPEAYLFILQWFCVSGFPPLCHGHRERITVTQLPRGFSRRKGEKYTLMRLTQRAWMGTASLFWEEVSSSSRVNNAAVVIQLV